MQRILPASETITDYCELYPRSFSSTIRTARSRISGEVPACSFHNPILLPETVSGSSGAVQSPSATL